MKYIEFSIIDEVATITICRPNSFNSLNFEVLQELKHCITELDFGSVRCLLMKGSGNRAFVAGADISEMVSLTKREAEKFSRYGNEVFNEIENLPFPVIAVINGYALGGGCELALACDFRICSDKSIFGQPETSLGIIPGFGGTFRLPRIVGFSKAKELIFTSKKINSADALEIGLVDCVCDESELDNKVNEFVSAIINNSAYAIRLAKESLKMTSVLDFSNEPYLFGEAFEEPDQNLRMSNFLSR